MRKPRVRSRRTPPPIGGEVAPGFEPVRAAFVEGFVERGEIGAAVAAYWRGRKVVDLWGGRRAPDRDAPWNEDTMVIVYSCTKGMAAMAVAVARARGLIDYEAPVARYWPAFAQGGKQAITVRQLLAHEAGLFELDPPLSIDMLRDLDALAEVLARQTPAWPPGTRHGYHAETIGLYLQELIRRTDPSHRTLGRFFHDELAVPLGLDFYIGLPDDIPDERLARVQVLSPRRALAAIGASTPELIARVLWPWSRLRRSMEVRHVDWNDRRTLALELPAGNGVGTARAMARAYSAFVEDDAALGLGPETLAAITAPPMPAHPHDEVLGIDSYFSLGFLRPGPKVLFGSSARAFGAPGAGGSFAFGDPDARLGFAYVPNKLDFYLLDDPRHVVLREALYDCLRRVATQRAAIAPEGAPAPA